MLQSTPYFDGPRGLILTKGVGGPAYKAWLCAQVEQMVLAGATASQMSVALRINENSVWRYARLLGLAGGVRRAQVSTHPKFWAAVQRFQADRAAAAQPRPESPAPGRVLAVLRTCMPTNGRLGSASIAALHEIGLCLDDLASLGVSYVDAVAAIREHHGAAQPEAA